MSQEDKFNKALKADLDQVKKESIKPGSPAMEAYLAAGYAPDIMNREQATLLIEGWKKDHTSCPYQLYQKALAYLAALDAKPSVKDIYHPPTNFRGDVVEAGSPDAL